VIQACRFDFNSTLSAHKEMNDNPARFVQNQSEKKFRHLKEGRKKFFVYVKIIFMLEENNMERKVRKKN
jgi:hypothetical protein